jgi:hypothetical protein
MLLHEQVEVLPARDESLLELDALYVEQGGLLRNRIPNV